MNDITVNVYIKPMHAIRMIEVEIPVDNVFRNFNRHKAYNLKVKTLTKRGNTPWFKNEYDRIGLGQKHMGRKYA